MDDYQVRCIIRIFQEPYCDDKVSKEKTYILYDIVCSRYIKRIFQGPYRDDEDSKKKERIILYDSIQSIPTTVTLKM